MAQVLRWFPVAKPSLFVCLSVCLSVYLFLSLALSLSLSLSPSLSLSAPLQSSRRLTKYSMIEAFELNGYVLSLDLASLTSDPLNVKVCLNPKVNKGRAADDDEIQGQGQGQGQEQGHHQQWLLTDENELESRATGGVLTMSGEGGGGELRLRPRSSEDGGEANVSHRLCWRFNGSPAYVECLGAHDQASPPQSPPSSSPSPTPTPLKAMVMDVKWASRSAGAVVRCHGPNGTAAQAFRMVALHEWV